MKFPWSWLMRRFWEFRVADAQYGRYFTGLTQWLVSVYTLYILRVPLLHAIFASILLFAVLFVVTYTPIMTIIGHFIHRKRQYHTEIEIATLENPYLWKAQPGIMTRLSLPISKRSLEKNIELWEKFNLLSEEDREFFKEKLKLYDRLIEGKTIK